MDQLFHLFLHLDSVIVAFIPSLPLALPGKSYQKVVIYIALVSHWGLHCQVKPSDVG